MDLRKSWLTLHAPNRFGSLALRGLVRAMPPRPKRWWQLTRRVNREADQDNLGIVSAGVAFYAFLAIFPALAALMSIYGLVTDPLQAEQQLHAIAGLMPIDVYRILLRQMRALAATPGGSLGLGLVSGILLAVWSASKGTTAMITALNIAYRSREQRGFFRRTGLALLVTLGGVLTGVVALLLVAVVPAIMSFLDLPARFAIAITLVRWAALAVLVALAIGLLYRFAPSSRLVGVPKRGGLTPGAVLATTLWLLASAGFSWYASHFGDYNKTYGSVGAVVVLLLWFSLGAYAVLLGAEFDAQFTEKRRAR